MGGEGKGKGKGGGFDGGFGKGKGKGGKKGGKKGKNRKGKGGEEAWVPCTKLGRLVKDRKITSIEDIYLHSLPIKEHQIIDEFFPKDKDGGRGVPVPGSGVLKDDVMKIMPVQKQTSAGQRNRFKAFVAIGDGNGHIGLGVKSSKEVAFAIRGGLIAAKINLIPVRRGYWGSKLGLPHTVPMKVNGKCGSVSVRLIPAPRGTGIVGAPTSKKLMAFAGISDCFTCSSGHTKTRGNFMKACFAALKNTYRILTPDLWKITAMPASPYQENSDWLMMSKSKKAAEAA
jgi:small subunit ribosomal protein S2e